MNPTETSDPSLPQALKECFGKIRFARAAELARCGRFLEAEVLLAPNGRTSSDPMELDLLARISAQQRLYGRACRLWDAALQQSPGNLAYQRAIERAKAAEQLQAKLYKWSLAVLMAVAALTLAVWHHFFQLSPTEAGEGKEEPGFDQKSLTPLVSQAKPAPPQPVPGAPPALSAPPASPGMPQSVPARVSRPAPPLPVAPSAVPHSQ
jgi:hypothetical protein